MPEVHALRIVAQRLVVVADGIGEVLLLNAAQASQLIDAHHIGVALDGLRAVGLGSGEIVQIVFGNGTVVPGLKQIGLGGDGLVEILDGEHIVLIIERRASYHHQTVSIELRHTDHWKEHQKED